MSEPEDTDAEWAEWRLTGDMDSFNARVRLPPHATSDKAEAEARRQLIKAIKSGDIGITWSGTRKTREEIHDEARKDYELVCPRCNDVTWSWGGEVILDDQVQMVCASCKEEMRDICNRCGTTTSDLSDGASVGVRIRDSGQAVEFVCPDCEDTA